MKVKNSKIVKQLNKKLQPKKSKVGFMRQALQKLPKGTLSAAGSALGSYFGPAGSKVGGAVGALIARISGVGDYVMNDSDISTNSLFGKVDRGVPQMHNNRHITRISHAEYLGDIICSATGTPSSFSLTSYDVNPGLASSFPWLSQVASNYETYRFNGLAYEYRSTSGDSIASTTTSLGTVIMAGAYNAASPNFITKVQMENYEGAISCKPSRNMLFGLECSRKLNVDDHLYIRTTNVPAGQDQKLFDLANFQLATQGMQANSVNLGELWVTYDVELYQPKLFANELDYTANYAHITSNTAVSTSHYFGTTNLETSGSNMPLVLGAATVTLPFYVTAGNYLIIYSIVQNSASITAPAINATSNCVGLDIIDNGALPGIAIPNYTGAYTVSYAYITVTGPSPVITFSGATLGTVTWMDLQVIQVNGYAN
jgi:hypothetical protein